MSTISEPLPIHVDLPVGLPADVGIVEVTVVVFGVSPSQEQLTTRFCVRVPDEQQALILAPAQVFVWKHLILKGETVVWFSCYVRDYPFRPSAAYKTLS